MNNITYVCGNNSAAIDNTNKVRIDQLNGILNGSLDDVYCDCLDDLENDLKISMIKQLMSKVGLKKSLKIKVLDKILLGKHMYFDTIEANELNDILNSVKSINSAGDITEIIAQNTNFEITSTYIDNNFYIIEAQRIR